MMWIFGTLLIGSLLKYHLNNVAIVQYHAYFKIPFVLSSDTARFFCKGHMHR